MTGTPNAPRGLQRLPVTEVAEIAASEELSRRLTQIEPLLDRYAKIAQLRPKPNAELADDDSRTSWLHLSHFVASCMAMASDSLASTQQLLLPDGQLEHRITAHFPLLRSAMESAGTALWLLQPNNQRERITRLLKARTSDIEWDLPLVKAAARIADQNTPEGRSMAQRAIRNAVARKRRHLTQIREIATREKIAPDEYSEGLPGYERIIEQATAHLDLPGASAPTVWRLISGLTHPSPLRMMDTSQHGQPLDNQDGTLYVLSSMSLGSTTTALLAAMMIYRQATEHLAYRIGRLRPHR
ncbi:hypothetical protein ACCO44_01480 [Microbacterium maritypicum]|uniref:hypothetical protein n=1 Tax=Microbacterium maritypicum TaxID=33918 RepID=UPI00355928B3